MKTHRCQKLEAAERIEKGKFVGLDRFADLHSAIDLVAIEQHGIWMLSVNREYGIPITHCPCCGEKLTTN